MDFVLLRHCPFCNGEPEFDDSRECYGHGDYAEETFVVCKSCGSRTMGISDHDFPSREARVLQAALLWNRCFVGD